MRKSKTKMRKSVTIEDYLGTDDDIVDFAALANANERYPTTIEENTSDMEKNCDRKQFKSKRFWYAENICWIVTSAIIILLFCLWIYFDMKCADV